MSDQSTAAVLDVDANDYAGEVRNIAMSLIDVNKDALRSVKRDTEAFQLLAQSIKQHGVLQSILVRPLPGGRFGLINGLQRFNCAMDAGLIAIPAKIVSMEDAEVMKAQIITNMNFIPTKPAELSKHLVRILSHEPDTSLDDLARTVHQSRDWVEKRLGLVKLTEDIQKLVDEEKIPLTNAYVLSSIDPEEQDKWVDQAASEVSNVFVPKIKARLAEIKASKNKGTDAEEVKWAPSQKLRRVADIKSELEAVVAGKPVALAEVFKTEGQKLDNAQAKLILEWCLTYDKAAQKQAEKDHEARTKARKEKEARQKAEREKLKAEKEKAKAADITVGV